MSDRIVESCKANATEPVLEVHRLAHTYGDVDEFSTDGVVEFALLGRTLRLRPFTTRPKRFYFVFRDASSGHETYGAPR